MLKRHILLLFAAGLLGACSSDDSPSDEGGGGTAGNDPGVVLFDKDLTTHYTSETSNASIVIKKDDRTPVVAYKLWSSGEKPAHDPVTWTLSGSTDGATWTVVDERTDTTFFSRYQEMVFLAKTPGAYGSYKLDVKTPGTDKLVLAEMELCTQDPLDGWRSFTYPAVEFNDLDPETSGSGYYKMLVQDPQAYVRYHALKIAEILYDDDQEQRTNIQKIVYNLKNYDGVSGKSGNPPVVQIDYSTQHVERSYASSLFKLDFETRGVLYHEMVHAYQFEPKGIPPYSQGNISWACIEGLADAVRAQSGFLDMTNRKAGGWYSDGYQTTGFFIQWLTTKDPDAIRKFHRSVRELSEWSFDGAMVYIFGEGHTAKGLWTEYQNFLKGK